MLPVEGTGAFQLCYITDMLTARQATHEVSVLPGRCHCCMMRRCRATVGARRRKRSSVHVHVRNACMLIASITPPGSADSEASNESTGGMNNGPLASNEVKAVKKRALLSAPTKCSVFNSISKKTPPPQKQSGGAHPLQLLQARHSLLRLLFSGLHGEHQVQEGPRGASQRANERLLVPRKAHRPRLPRPCTHHHPSRISAALPPRTAVATNRTCHLERFILKLPDARL
jgi:hypothetical protein